MTLITDTTYNGLAVCGKCGWPVAGPYEESQHSGACPYVTIGANACALAERVDELPSTKFGYGTRQLTFEMDENLHVQLECDKDGTFKLREWWMLDGMTTDEAADLVRAIAAWRRGCNNMRRR